MVQPIKQLHDTVLKDWGQALAESVQSSNKTPKLELHDFFFLHDTVTPEARQSHGKIRTSLELLQCNDTLTTSQAFTGLAMRKNAN